MDSYNQCGWVVFSGHCENFAKVRWQLYLPPVPHGDEHAAVVGLAASHLAADGEVNLVPREVVEPLTLFDNVTENYEVRRKEEQNTLRVWLVSKL